MRAGFLGVALCAAAAWIFILPPSGQISIATSDQFVTIAFFIAVASADVLLIGALRLAIAHYRRLGQALLTQTAELRASEEQQRLLAAEVDHRAKNVLALVQSILRQTRAANIESYIDTVSGRIMALARSHSLIAASRWQGAELAQIIDAELAPYRAPEGRASHRCACRGEWTAREPAPGGRSGLGHGNPRIDDECRQAWRAVQLGRADSPGLGN
jgi:hypothetical protein